MKKITLLLVLVSAMTFAQDVAPTFTWTNRSNYLLGGETTNVTFKPGDVVPITLNYTLGSTGGVANTFYFILGGLQQEAPANKAVDASWANNPAPGASFMYPGPGAGGTVTFNYTIPAASELSSSAGGLTKTYRMLVYLAYYKGGNTSGATTVYGGVGAGNEATFIVKIRSAAEVATLGLNDFSKVSLKSFSPNPVKDVITFGSDVQTKNYTVYSLNGSEVLNEKATGTLNVSSLAKGVYILTTDAGSAKIIKE